MVWNHDGRMPSVMNQLLEMERSLNNFMLETILKMQTLTQTKVFLLLESKHYRRYGGSPELVLCFENSNFKLNNDAKQIDIQVDLDASANLLRECRKRHKNKRGPARPKDDGAAAKKRSSSGGPQPPTMDDYDHEEYYENDVTDDGPSPSKKSRGIDNGYNGYNDWSADDSPPKGVNNGVNVNHSTASSAAAAPADAAPFVKIETPVFTESQVTEVLDHLEARKRFNVPDGRLSSSTGHIIPTLEDDDVSFGIHGGGGGGGNEEDYVIGIPFQDGMYSFDRIVHSQKYKTLMKIEDVSRAFVKGNWEFGLLGSTLYDIGKELANSCPIEDVQSNREEVKAYLNMNMDKFLPLFSRFTVEKVGPHKEVLRSYSPESYMKGRIRGGFKRQKPLYYKTREGSKNSKTIARMLAKSPKDPMELM